MPTDSGAASGGLAVGSSRTLALAGGTATNITVSAGGTEIVL
jgi:hypothetical protein